MIMTGVGILGNTAVEEADFVYLQRECGLRGRLRMRGNLYPADWLGKVMLWRSRSTSLLIVNYAR